MSDILKCMGFDCPLRENCYRFKAPNNDLYQSYLYEPPYNNGTCELFYEIPTTKKSKNMENRYKQSTVDNIINFYNDLSLALYENKNNLPSFQLVELYKKHSIPPTTLKCFIKLGYVNKIAPSTYINKHESISLSKAIRVLALRNKMQREYLKNKKEKDKAIFNKKPRKKSELVEVSEPVKVYKPFKLRTEPRKYTKKKKSIFIRLFNFIFGK